MVTAGGCDKSDLCLELAGGDDTEFRATYPSVQSRVLSEDDDNAAIVDLSPICKGHVLVCPRVHFYSIAQALHDDRGSGFLDFLQPFLQRYKLTFGGFSILEHGSTATMAGSACISHAHLHIVPLPLQSLVSKMREDGLHLIEYDGWEAVRDSLHATPYFLATDDEKFWGSSAIRPYTSPILSDRDGIHARNSLRRVRLGSRYSSSSFQRDYRSLALTERRIKCSQRSQIITQTSHSTNHRSCRKLLFLRWAPNNYELSSANGSSAELTLGAAAQDDCAAFLINGQQTLVAGSDYIRGVKFSLYEAGLLSDYDIGWYLAGANLSDIAAMGAVPAGLLSVVRYPKDLEDQRFAELIQGIRDGSRACGALNVGGDIGSAERIILSASAFGFVEPQCILKRTSAMQGQLVCLTGPTGLAGSAMKLVQAGDLYKKMGHTFEPLLEKWRRVQPRVAHGRLFAQAPSVTACLDTSDGLKGALATLADASGVAIIIDAERIPIHPSVVQASELLKTDVLELVFGDSVDFELVATVDKGDIENVVARCDAAGLSLHVIGEVTAGAGTALRRSSSTDELPGEAWKHT